MAVGLGPAVRSQRMDYQVDLDVFRGPLDLLLYLVKRNEVDVIDIPIARVAEQFIEYLGVLEFIDVERAGDFLVMAATLMEIKSRMLLPRAEDEAGELDNTRLELVRQLMEYKRYKEAALLLEAQAEKQLSRLPRQPAELPTASNPIDQPLHSVELWDLVSAFGRLMRETLALEPQQIVDDQTPIHVYMENISEMFRRHGRLAFSAVFTPPYSRSRLVGLFLAILELIKSRKITAEQPDPFGEIWLLAMAGDGTPV
jgi:segregation and condensation protein A